MNKYVVAVYHYMTGELVQEIVDANTKLEAAKSYLQDHDEYTSLQAMKNHYDDNELAAINVIQINKSEKAKAWSMPSLATIAGFKQSMSA